jgi:hypothetical protein
MFLGREKKTRKDMILLLQSKKHAFFHVFQETAITDALTLIQKNNIYFIDYSALFVHSV